MTDEAINPVARLENLEAEGALLGAIMIDNALVDRVSEFLTHTDFAVPVHGRIYRAVMRMRANGEAATPVTLRPIFDDDEDLASVGGAHYLGKLTGNGAVLVGALDCARQIASLSRLRVAREAIVDALAKIDEKGVIPDVADIQGELDMRLWATRDATAQVQYRAPEEMVGATRERSQAAGEAGEAPGAKNRWISDLNTAIGNLEGSTMIILAARPSMGKTAAAVSASLGYAAAGEPMLYISHEMSKAQMDLRVTADLCFAANTDIKHKMLKKGDLTPAQWRQLERVEAIAAALPIKFVSAGRCDISKVISIIAREVARLAAIGRKLRGVVIDYMGLIEATSLLGDRDIGNDRLKTNAVSGALLAAAHRFDIAVIALSQLNRKVEDRPGAVPMLSDLRESGRLEEDADAVVLLHRPEYYMERETKPTDPKKLEQWNIDWEACKGRLDLIVAKNRHGQAMKRPAKFFGDTYSVRGSDFGQYDPLFEHDAPSLLDGWNNDAWR